MQRALLAIGSTLAAATLLCGCDNRDDEQLWGGALSPTQEQKAEMGPPPVAEMPDPEDGVSEDPFIGNPNFPYTEDSFDDPGSTGG